MRERASLGNFERLRDEKIAHTARRRLARDLDTVTHVPSVTQSESRVVGAAGRRQAPGALLVFTVNQPLFARIDLSVGETLWGRNDLSGIRVSDARLSQAHLKIRWDAGAFRLVDVSRHGTFVNGVRIPTEREVTANGGDVVRMGRTLVILMADVSEYRGTIEPPQGHGPVIGPRLQQALDAAASARERNKNLVILGENGAGKELVATHYHRSSKKPGPLVPVNASTLKNGTATSVLFGAVSGVFTDVKASGGLIGSADGGVLFLDEIAELDDKVQSDFLRVLETGKYRVTGAKEETAVQLNVVTASHQSLRDRVASGQFRQDLYYRLNQEHIELPPLRERREEIPFLMGLEVREGESALHVSAVERALLLPWPGNLRELRNATASAAARAAVRFKEEAPARRLEGIKPEDDGPAEVRDTDFAPDAGTALGPGSAPPAPAPPGPPPAPRSPAAPAAVHAPREPDPNRSPDVLKATLERNGYNIKKSAAELGLNRTQLYREMDKHGLKRPGDEPPPTGTLGEDE